MTPRTCALCGKPGGVAWTLLVAAARKANLKLDSGDYLHSPCARKLAQQLRRLEGED